MDRKRASLVHLLISAAIAGALFLVVRLVWYPGPLFQGAGGQELFFVLVTVHVTLGPLVTLIVFRPGKPGLKLDLATIALLQLAALGYGVHVITEARPVWIAFLKDRFELVRANDIEPEDLRAARAPYDRLPWTGPRFIGAKIPSDVKEQMRLMDSAVRFGKDVFCYPRHYVAYAEVARDAIARSAPIAKLRSLNAALGEPIDRLVADSGRVEGDLAFLPMRAGKRDLTVLIDRTSGEPLSLSTLRPWEF